MKLSLALALITLGTSCNAFASSPNVSFVSKPSELTNTAVTIHTPVNAVRGGSDDSSTCLAATKEGVTMSDAVSKYISDDNWSLLSERGQAALNNLITGDEDLGAQTHVYADWPEKGTDDEGKTKLSEQVSIPLDHV